ncbi:MAG: hypothetical protein IPP07_12490 [Holophagales bacterium]|nr:hypothetical protein [Holophagales bacterium]MBK9965670.1 hypothetical protein [Holophagales bacterium]
MSIPYVVGQWVRGDRFYGRPALLREALEGSRDRHWIVGMRRVGKTSLLRQIEQLAFETPGGSVVPVVWDLQGSDEPDELDLGFHDALLDAESRLAEAGVAPPPPGPAAETIADLAGALRERGRKLLLLCDETEDLFGLLSREPDLAVPLERALTASGARVVLASSVRLAATAGSGPGAGLLAAFGTPAWLGPFDAGESRALLLQENLPPERRPELPEAAVRLLASRCGGHPFLLQLAAKRAVETGDAAQACERLARDPTVTHLCDVDLGLLESADRELLAGLSAGIETSPPPSPVHLARLRGLGLVRDGADGRPVPGNWFLGRHLAAQAPAPGERTSPPPGAPKSGQRKAPTRTDS